MTELNEPAIDQRANAGLADKTNAMPKGSGYWRRDVVLVVLAVISAVSAIGFLLLLGLGLIDSLFGLPTLGIPLLTNLFDWLRTDSRGLIIAVGFAIVGLIAFLLFRMRALNNLSLYVGADCPQCGEHEYIRVSRRQLDRVVARMGIPVRRYVCRNCSWDGLRIGRPLPGSEAQILPAEMLLATGDGGVQAAEIPAEEAR